MLIKTGGWFVCTRNTKGQAVVLAVVVVLAGGCGSGSEPEVSQAPSAIFEEAVDLLKRGEGNEAVEVLREVMRADPEGREGDKAALFLGNILVGQKRHMEALAPLDRAAAGSVGAPYASILIVRSVVDGGIQERYTEAAGRAASLAGGEVDGASPLLEKEATYLLCKLRSAQEVWDQTVSRGSAYLDRWPDSPKADEVRWKVATALDQAGRTSEAYAVYETIWYESPASPWAKEAKGRLEALRRAQGFAERKLSATERYDFIMELRRVGLHDDALAEMERFEQLHPGHSKTDGLLFMKAMSQYDLRRNSDCVRTVEEVRRRFPRSQWVPSASIYAVKALRRSDNTPQIKKWCYRIYNENPGHTKAYEALYNLGVYLGNVESEQEGVKVLRKLVSEAPRHESADDSLWKIAWMERRDGNTAAALEALDKLLRDNPDSGYRKAALYWQARMRFDLGLSGADDLYQTLLEEFPNDYYGHKAYENLLAMNLRPRQIGNRKALTGIDLLDNPARYTGSGAENYRRACNLKKLGLYEFAADELREVPAAAEDPSLQFALAELSSRSGDTWKAASIIGQHFKEFMVAGSRDPNLVPMELWHIVYPFNYRDIITTAIEKAGLANTRVDPYLVASLIRMESRFLPTAVSPVGAVGLMQLMPDTAQQIAAERGIAPPTHDDLFTPRTNIDYGTFFLAKRVQDFGGDWFPAICSYNAGVGPVKSWWDKRQPGEEDDEFIENIPYVATRLYIKQILGDYYNYEWIYPS